MHKFLRMLSGGNFVVIGKQGGSLAGKGPIPDGENWGKRGNRENWKGWIYRNLYFVVNC